MPRQPLTADQREVLLERLKRARAAKARKGGAGAAMVAAKKSKKPQSFRNRAVSQGAKEGLGNWFGNF
jgi:hypothetical protein